MSSPTNAVVFTWAHYIEVVAIKLNIGSGCVPYFTTNIFYGGAKQPNEKLFVVSVWRIRMHQLFSKELSPDDIATAGEKP